MPNQYSSDKQTIGSLLSYSTPEIKVPDFQRDYTWDTSLLESFWEDLLMFSDKYPLSNLDKQEYFLGPMVFINEGSKRILLDGQQRLATCTILLSVIRDFLKKLGNSDAANSIQQKYISEHDFLKDVRSYSLTLNDYDRQFFVHYIQEMRDENYKEPKPKLASHSLIKKAREFFSQKIGTELNKIKQEKAKQKWLLRVAQVLTDHVSVVAVWSEDEDNASTVFETLNDRGIGLSSPDLLRNLLLKQARKSDREPIVKLWKSIFEMEGAVKIEDFLRHFWLSRYGDVKSRSLYREIKKTIKAEDLDSLSFTKELEREAKMYENIILATDTDPEVQELLEGISSLGAKALLPAVLSAFAVGNTNEKRSLLNKLTSLFVRHTVIGGLENTKIEDLAFKLARDLRKNKKFSRSGALIKQLMPKDSEFLTNFKNASIAKSPVARYILSELEQTFHGTDEFKLENSKKVNLEHIYPENPSFKQWEGHDLCVYKIGNLTLLSVPLNKDAKNSTFKTKKGSYSKSEIVITKKLAECKKWSPAEIAKRQSDFAKIALQIWPSV